MRQAREAQHARRDWREQDPRWGGRRLVRWGHAVVMLYTRVDDDFAMLDAQRWQVAGRDDLGDLAGFVRGVILEAVAGSGVLRRLTGPGGGGPPW